MNLSYEDWPPLPQAKPLKYPSGTEVERQSIFISGCNNQGQQTFTIGVLLSDEVCMLKSLIKGKTGISPKDQFLTYAGKVLTSGKLRDYFIQHGSTLELSCSLLGGSDNEILTKSESLSSLISQNKRNEDGKSYDFARKRHKSDVSTNAKVHKKLFKLKLLFFLKKGSRCLEQWD